MLIERMAVFLADTWLHVTTKTVSFIQVSPVTGSSNYSLSLIPGCAIGNNTIEVVAKMVRVTSTLLAMLYSLQIPLNHCKFLITPQP
jgi:hypothetical protein